jgi:hypothetical protein
MKLLAQAGPLARARRRKKKAETPFSGNFLGSRNWRNRQYLRPECARSASKSPGIDRISGSQGIN